MKPIKTRKRLPDGTLAPADYHFDEIPKGLSPEETNAFLMTQLFNLTAKLAIIEAELEKGGEAK